MSNERKSFLIYLTRLKSLSHSSLEAGIKKVLNKRDRATILQIRAAMDLRWLSSEALVAETVPETLTKEKQEKLIINKSNCEQDNCGSVGYGLQPNRSRGIDNSKHVDNLEELDIIKEHVKNVQNSPDRESPETARQLDSLLCSQEMTHTRSYSE